VELKLSRLDTMEKQKYKSKSTELFVKDFLQMNKELNFSNEQLEEVFSKYDDMIYEQEHLVTRTTLKELILEKQASLNFYICYKNLLGDKVQHKSNLNAEIGFQTELLNFLNSLPYEDDYTIFPSDEYIKAIKAATKKWR